MCIRDRLEKETLDHNELAEIFTDVKRLTPRPQWLSSGDRPVSDQPPIEVPRRQQAAGIAASTEAEAQAATKAQPRPSGQTRPATA